MLHTALPDVTVPITLEGHSTIARSTAGATPAFSLLTVASGGALTTDDIDFVNGAAPAHGGAINGNAGPVTCTAASSPATARATTAEPFTATTRSS